jgi:hypothetical protein
MRPTFDRTGTRCRTGRRWPSGAVLGAAALLVIACGHLWFTSTTPVPAPPRDVYACVLAQAIDLGYKTVVDTGNPGRRNLGATKELPLAQRGPDPTVLTRSDKLTILVQRDESGGASSLKVTAGTISRHNDRRGFTEVNESANPQVRHDADAIVAHCRTASPQTSLPGSSSALPRPAPPVS